MRKRKPVGTKIAERNRKEAKRASRDQQILDRKFWEKSAASMAAKFVEGKLWGQAASYYRAAAFHQQVREALEKMEP